MTEQEWKTMDRPCDHPTCDGTMECVERTIVQQRSGDTTTTYTFVCDTCFLGRVI